MKERFWSLALVAVVFLGLGITGVLAYQSFTKSEPEESEVGADTQKPVTESQPVAPSPEPEAIDYQAGSSDLGGAGGGKFTILETQKMYADRYTVQTGETVNFFTKLKNTGSQKNS